MKRWVLFSACVTVGLVILACGLLLPVHLRAVDIRVVQKAGEHSPSLIDRGLALVREKKLGAAELMLEAAQHIGVPQRAELIAAVTNLARQPEVQPWGSPEPRLQYLLRPLGGPNAASAAPAKAEPFTEFIIRIENRRRALELLDASRTPAVQELLRCRTLTNTVIFSPSSTSSGQAFDAAVSICGLLIDAGYLTPSLSKSVLTMAASANRGENPQPIEQVLLDLMSLGQRFNWGQLVEFVRQVEDAETLRLLANLVRKADAQLPVLFSAVELSGKPALTARYLVNFSETGFSDVGESLRYGAGGVDELLTRNQRLNQSKLHRSLNATLHPFIYLGWRMPRFGLTLKWLLYLLAGFLLAIALHFAKPAASALERPLQVGGFHLAREFLFALGFLLAVLLLSEPFLAQESQKMEFPIRLHLPTLGSAVAAGNISVNRSIMNQLSILTLVLFFVLQGLLYTASLVKLAEIRRQRVPSRMKLKLLENEDHLFDAGLYLGFAGTIISLILVSLGVIQPSLMAAYSSTSFGIIFVCVFKIFNLRPLRRTLLLEAEAARVEALSSQSAQTLAAPL